MEVSVGVFGVFCLTLVSIVAIGSNGANSKIANEAIDALKFSIDVILGKRNRK